MGGCRNGFVRSPRPRFTTGIFDILGLYPGNQITRATPDLLTAARRSLEVRINEEQGGPRAGRSAFGPGSATATTPSG